MTIRNRILTYSPVKQYMLYIQCISYIHILFLYCFQLDYIIRIAQYIVYIITLVTIVTVYVWYGYHEAVVYDIL